ncbi:putative transcriptional regulator; phage SPbeta [Carnobacterium sp. 17-4]|uniref:helix-turn-helix domain-containing protein n=1 Tax=Carnobacterium sp. (strain 17-4) TaxID=208596 RepID=UPI0002058CD9|nr:helix-turn-helix transcriptional regulator [Carnobacterium sp. 17-4]AEB29579.1 putative transcriptional regulator; phage SPbeta [Carnobacterium sp. 17-4]
MIRCNLKSILDNREISINKLSNDTGISRQSITSLVNNDSKGIQFNTLDTLIEFLDIDLTDIIEYTTSYQQLFIEIDIEKQNDTYEYEVDILPSGLLKNYYGNFVLVDVSEDKKYYCPFHLAVSYVGETLNSYVACHLNYSDDNNLFFREKGIEFNPDKITKTLSSSKSLIEVAYEIINSLIANSFNVYKRSYSNKKFDSIQTNKQGIFNLEFSLLGRKSNPVYEFETKFDKSYIYVVPDMFEGNDNLEVIINELDI